MAAEEHAGNAKLAAPVEIDDRPLTQDEIDAFIAESPDEPQSAQPTTSPPATNFSQWDDVDTDIGVFSSNGYTAAADLNSGGVLLTAPDGTQLGTYSLYADVVKDAKKHYDTYKGVAAAPAIAQQSLPGDFGKQAPAPVVTAKAQAPATSFGDWLSSPDTSGEYHSEGYTL
jgi:hypothetical protein